MGFNEMGWINTVYFTLTRLAGSIDCQLNHFILHHGQSAAICLTFLCFSLILSLLNLYFVPSRKRDCQSLVQDIVVKAGVIFDESSLKKWKEMAIPSYAIIACSVVEFSDSFSMLYVLHFSVRFVNHRSALALLRINQYKYLSTKQNVLLFTQKHFYNLRQILTCVCRDRCHPLVLRLGGQ